MLIRLTQINPNDLASVGHILINPAHIVAMQHTSIKDKDGLANQFVALKTSVNEMHLVKESLEEIEKECNATKE